MTQHAVHPGLTFAQYAALPGLNAHTLIPFVKSALNGAYKASAPDEPDDDLRIGEAIHRRILEPELFDQTVVIVDEVEIQEEVRKPKGHKVRKVGDAETMALADAANPGKLVLTSEMAARTKAMRDAAVERMRTNPLLRKALTAPGRNELSIQWMDPDLGVLCKARLDRFLDCGILADLKTTKDPDPRKFVTQVADYGYDVQNVWYRRGAFFCRLWHALPPGLLVVMGKPAPHEMYAAELPQEWDEVAWLRAEQAFFRWKAWKETGEAPGVVPGGYLTLPMPAWLSAGNERSKFALTGGSNG